MHAFDGQTEGRTDRRTDGRTDGIFIARPRLHSMQRGKNQRNLDICFFCLDIMMQNIACCLGAIMLLFITIY